MEKAADTSISTTSLVSSELDGPSRRCFCAHPAWVVVPLFLVTCQASAEHITKDIVAELFPQEARTWAITGPQVIVSLLSFFCTPMLGRFADIHGRKPALLLCTAVLAVPYICLWAFRMDKSMSSYVGFMVLNCLSGFVGGIGGVTLICFGYLADCISPNHRAAVAGLVTAISCIGSAEAPDIYSRLWSEGDTPSRCLLTIMVVHIASVSFCVVMPESCEKRSTSQSKAAMSLNPLRNFRLLTQPEKTDSRSCLRKLFVALFLLYISKFAVKYNIDVYAKDTYNFTTTQRGKLQQMYGFVEIVGHLMFAVGARFGLPHRVLICVGALLAFLSPLLLALPNMKIWSLYVADALLALAPGVLSVSLAMATEVVRPSESAEAVAVVKAALSLANATGRALYSCLSALFLTSNYSGAIFLVLSVVAFVDVGFCFVLPSKRQLQQIRDGVQPACDACSEC